MKVIRLSSWPNWLDPVKRGLKRLLSSMRRPLIGKSKLPGLIKAERLWVWEKIKAIKS